MTDPIVAIEVGNSRVKAGQFESAPTGGLPPCVTALAFPVKQAEPAAMLGRWIEEHAIRPVAILLSGTNPPVVSAIREGWQRSWGRLTLLDRPSPSNLKNRTDAPERVGADRLFDAVAANRLRPAGTSAIVIDSGTATTVNFIDEHGAFRGGAIVAGYDLIATALHERTALLPRIDSSHLTPPPEPLGRNTEAALRSGLYWGLVGSVKELVARFTAAFENDERAPLALLTGGAAPLLAPHLPVAQVEPYLTLQGMVLSA